MDSKKIASNLLIVGLILVALYFGKALIIPFVLSFVFWYLLNSIKRLVGGIRIGDKKLPWYVQILSAAAILIGLATFLGKMVARNFEEFVEVYPKYHANIIEISESITANYNLPFSMDELVHRLDLPSLMTEILNSSLNLVSTIFIVLIYVIFIILEERIFPQKLKMIFTSAEKFDAFSKTMQKIDDSIRTYLSIKTGLCFLSAVLSYVVLIIIGVDFAVLWAFLIFLFTFIPIIGAFVGVLFPTIIAFIQFEGYFDAVLVLCLLSVAQLIIGNFIEPKVLGDKLNLSPLSVIIALSFWGALWGVAGMFLCVPITVILMIIFAQFPTTRPIAILLSGGRGFSDPDDPE